jgi:hypothetical protein
MDVSSYMYRRNFDLDKKNETITIAGKEHLKMSKIAKFGPTSYEVEFGCELL